MVSGETSAADVMPWQVHDNRLRFQSVDVLCGRRVIFAHLGVRYDAFEADPKHVTGRIEIEVEGQR
jgi:hypothetical protein